MNLKLSRLTDEQENILKRVVEEYYVALPAALKVHSLFATHILSQTLHRYGIRTRVLPCRLWCSLPSTEREFPGGFVNFHDKEKWNGHVVCLAGDWLVDAAMYHLNPTYNGEVPNILARRILLPEPGTYASYRLNKTTEFVWYRLPSHIPAVSVDGYEDFIERFVTMLVQHVNALLGIADDQAGEPAAIIDGAQSTGEAPDMAADSAVDAGDNVAEDLIALTDPEPQDQVAEDDALPLSEVMQSEAETV